MAMGNVKGWSNTAGYPSEGKGQKGAARKREEKRVSRRETLKRACKKNRIGEGEERGGAARARERLPASAPLTLSNNERSTVTNSGQTCKQPRDSVWACLGIAQNQSLSLAA